MHAIITCYMLLLYYTPVVKVIMYRGVFTVGVAVTRNSLTDATDFLTDYSYIYASDSPGSGVLLARCVTGLGPTGTSNNANSDLGGWYFNGTMIPNSGVNQVCGSPAIDNKPAVGAIQARPGFGTAGVINLRQCDPFTIALEGIYTCTMMNSAMMSQSVRLGVYFSVRSESLDLKLCISHHLTIFHVSTQLLQ